MEGWAMTTTTETRAPEGYTFACERDAIPTRGKKTVHIGDVTVLIIACNGHLYAVEDRCPQTGRSIVRGEVLGREITTPIGARYSLDTGQYLGGGHLPLPLQSHWLTLFPLKVIADRVYVRLPGE
jgi:nitrite reductase/ring-hydroxylating ferredoxin subunit